MVAGAWMGLAVKTDGAAVASGAIADALIRARAAAEGIHYQADWIMGATATVKVFIDVFIGVWAFVLAVIWASLIERKAGDKVRAREIWQRFPKFVIGYVVTFALVLLIALPASKDATELTAKAAALGKQAAAETVSAGAPTMATQADHTDTKERLGAAKAKMTTAKLAAGEANLFRGLFFVMTFFTIGVVSNFRKLWEEGIGKLAAVYAVSLFGFIIWVGLLISWIFFHGVKPPLAS